MVEATSRIAPVNHAATRLADAVVVVLRSSDDTPTLNGWARKAGISGTLLRERCNRMGMRAKAALDLARCVRLVMNVPAWGWRPHELLDLADTRTVRALLRRGGLSHLRPPPDLPEYLRSSPFRVPPSVVDALEARLSPGPKLR